MIWENYPHTLPDRSWITFDWIGETRGQRRRRLAREAALPAEPDGPLPTRPSPMRHERR